MALRLEGVVFRKLYLAGRAVVYGMGGGRFVGIRTRVVGADPDLEIIKTY